MSVDNRVLQRKVDRERRARQEAESLLERKSAEVYQANQELQRLSERLRDQAELTAAIIETAADGILTFDGDGRVRSMNSMAKAMFAVEGPAESDDDIVADSDLFVQQLISPLPGHPATDAYYLADSEYLARRAGGDVFPVQWSVGQVDSGNSTFWTAFVHDLTNRKKLELQLAHGQKMESVGRLAAGIAHEINTPVQYVGDNVRFLSEAFTDVSRLMRDYDAFVRLTEVVCPEVTELRSARDGVRQAAAEIDSDYLAEEIPAAFEQSLDGIERVAEIVRAMKEFSHPGLEHAGSIDLNKAIENTIAVSRNEWKYYANLETSLDESLQYVNCHAGELNQALLNLIVNAAHAIAAKRNKLRSADMGLITISTAAEGNKAVIEISDTGIGIPADVCDRIFDPFFTTKEVGVGTGQGLAIVHSVIVNRHHGTISVDSVENVGTTFRIEIPVEAPEESCGLSVYELAEIRMAGELSGIPVR